MKGFVSDLGSQFCKSIIQQKWIDLLALQYSLCVNRISLTVEADNGLRWRVKWIESTLYPLQHCIALYPHIVSAQSNIPLCPSTKYSTIQPISYYYTILVFSIGLGCSSQRWYVWVASPVFSWTLPTHLRPFVHNLYLTKTKTKTKREKNKDKDKDSTPTSISPHLIPI